MTRRSKHERARSGRTCRIQPSAHPGEGVVTIDGAGACRTNLPIIDSQFTDRILVELPFIPGHEHAGFVVAFSAAVRRVRPGAPLVVSPPITDGTSRARRLG
ncbi:alcohol dehydrogenase catalytic domain-containing protein [Thermomicrobium sp.]